VLRSPAGCARRLRGGTDGQGKDNSPCPGRDREGRGTALSIATDATQSGIGSCGLCASAGPTGRPEVFVYNAGAFQLGGILEVTPSSSSSVGRPTALAGFFGAQQVLPAMVARRRGTILLTGATGSLRGGARFACLAVGKFGLRAWHSRWPRVRPAGRPCGPHYC